MPFFFPMSSPRPLLFNFFLFLPSFLMIFLPLYLALTPFFLMPAIAAQSGVIARPVVSAPLKADYGPDGGPDSCYSQAADSLEIKLYAALKKEFNLLKKTKYSKKYIFAAVADIKDGRIIFTSSREFYCKNKISPGSIIKIFDYALIIKYIKNAEYDIFFCRDNLYSGARRYNCSQKGGHGELSLDAAFYRSCNLYFKNYMQKITRRQFTAALFKCGFINAAEEEKLLLAPQNEYLQSVIGDKNIKVTPEKLIELARFLAAGDSVSKPFPVSYSEVFNHAAREKINAAMRRVAFERTGTAAAALNGLDCAAKTGSASFSARIENNKKIILTAAVFLGYAPYCEPKYAVITFCETGLGGDDGAFIAARLLSAAGISSKAD